MSRWFHVWWLLLIALIVGALIVLYGLFNTSQQLNANSLYDAVYDSAQYARDDSARESRGTFVINRNAFEKRLSSYNIRGIGAVGGKNSENGSGNNSHNKLYIHYYLDNPDSEYKEYQNSNNVKNEQVNSDSYNHGKHNKYISVRAIQVQAITNSQEHRWKNANGKVMHAPSNKKIIEEADHQKDLNPAKITNVTNKYVATLVVQSQDALKHGNYIQHMKRFEEIPGKRYTDNDPIRSPNETKRNSVDLTIPSYDNENDNHKALNTNTGFY